MLKQKLCRVCDRPLSEGRGKSKEHVIPNWMQQRFNLENKSLTYTPLESMDIPVSMQLTPPAPHHPQRQHNFGSLQVGSVCKNCNDGWMSDIETAAKDELIELIEGGKIINRSLAVARWALKTAYTFTIATDPPCGRVPQRHIQHLKDQTDLPAGVRIFARVDDESEWWFSSSSTFMVEIQQPAPDFAIGIAKRHFYNSYRYFLRLGGLTLLVQYWPSSVDLMGYNADLLMPVASNGGVYPFQDDDFEGFPHPHQIYDLVIRSTKCHLSLEKRQPWELCLCGSGITSGSCVLLKHPKDTAGNWGILDHYPADSYEIAFRKM